MPFDFMGEVTSGNKRDPKIKISDKYMEKNMKCPHLIKGVICSCEVLDNQYIPSLFELQEYCRTRHHRKCPFLLRKDVEPNANDYSCNAFLSA
jgi:hypothetical protein